LRVVNTYDAQALLSQPSRIGARAATNVDVQRPGRNSVPGVLEKTKSRSEAGRRPSRNAGIVVAEIREFDESPLPLLFESGPRTGRLLDNHSVS
jgi:hypothetical protein